MVAFNPQYFQQQLSSEQYRDMVRPTVQWTQYRVPAVILTASAITAGVKKNPNYLIPGLVATAFAFMAIHTLAEYLGENGKNRILNDVIKDGNYSWSYEKGQVIAPYAQHLKHIDLSECADPSKALNCLVKINDMYKAAGALDSAPRVSLYNGANDASLQEAVKIATMRFIEDLSRAWSHEKAAVLSEITATLDEVDLRGMTITPNFVNQLNNAVSNAKIIFPTPTSKTDWLMAINGLATSGSLNFTPAFQTLNTVLTQQCSDFNFSPFIIEKGRKIPLQTSGVDPYKLLAEEGLVGYGEEVYAFVENLLRYNEGKWKRVFDNFGVAPERGCLFHGPPGTGKTVLARAIAKKVYNATGENFIIISPSDIMSKWYGDSEKSLKELFVKLNKKPTDGAKRRVVFFDEIDSLFPNRQTDNAEHTKRILNEFLQLLSSKDAGNPLVIGATNRPDNLDPAIKRSGRLGFHVEVGTPNAEGCQSILESYIQQAVASRLCDAGIPETLKDKLVGLTGADIEAIYKDAVKRAVKAAGNPDRVHVTLHHFEIALTSLKAAQEASRQAKHLENRRAPGRV